MKINSGLGGFNLAVSAAGVQHKPAASFHTMLNDSLRTVDAIDKSMGYGKEEALRLARQDGSYADDVMNAFINDLGGPLIDVTDPNAIRFSVSGELVTEESMIYYREVNQVAKKGYIEIYAEGKARGESSEKIFEKFISFNSSLPPRYKQMANIWY